MRALGACMLALGLGSVAWPLMIRTGTTASWALAIGGVVLAIAGVGLLAAAETRGPGRERTPGLGDPPRRRGQAPEG